MENQQQPYFRLFVSLFEILVHISTLGTVSLHSSVKTISKVYIGFLQYFPGSVSYAFVKWIKMHFSGSHCSFFWITEDEIGRNYSQFGLA